MSAAKEPKYRWNWPSDWLYEHIGQANGRELYALCRDLASLIDEDTIQDEFQSLMDADGYFDPIPEPGCGRVGPEGYHCTHHERGMHVARGVEADSWAEEWPLEGE